MDDKNAAVLKQILQHTGSIVNYCADCHSREEFERDSMRVEATGFNLMITISTEKGGGRYGA